MTRRYSTAEKDQAVALWHSGLSYREVAARTGMSIGTIRIHARNRAANTARLWAHATAAKVLDGLDLTILVPDELDETDATLAWQHLIDQLRDHHTPTTKDLDP